MVVYVAVMVIFLLVPGDVEVAVEAVLGKGVVLVAELVVVVLFLAAYVIVLVVVMSVVLTAGVIPRVSAVVNEDEATMVDVGGVIVCVVWVLGFMVKCVIVVLDVVVVEVVGSVV